MMNTKFLEVTTPPSIYQFTSFFDICNLFYSCNLNIITGEIIVKLIIYLHDFISPLSFFSFEHKDNDTIATVVAPFLSDNGKLLFVLFFASIQSQNYGVT